MILVVVRDHVEGMTQHLNFDSEQQETIRALLRPHMSQMLDQRRRTDEINRRLSAAFAAPVFDREAFVSLAHAASVARAKVDSLSSVMLLKEAEVLTPEQRSLYAEVAPTIHVDPRRTPPPPRRPGR